MNKKTMIRVLLFMICFSASLSYVAPYDDTDNTETNERSGLKLFTDYGTGCQYIAPAFGSIYPRMDGRKHVGCRNGRL